MSIYGTGILSPGLQKRAAGAATTLASHVKILLILRSGRACSIGPNGNRGNGQFEGFSGFLEIRLASEAC